MQLPVVGQGLGDSGGSGVAQDPVITEDHDPVRPALASRQGPRREFLANLLLPSGARVGGDESEDQGQDQNDRRENVPGPLPGLHAAGAAVFDLGVPWGLLRGTA